MNLSRFFHELTQNSGCIYDIKASDSEIYQLVQQSLIAVSIKRVETKYPKTVSELPWVRYLACTQEVPSPQACQGHTYVGSKRASSTNEQINPKRVSKTPQVTNPKVLL